MSRLLRHHLGELKALPDGYVSIQRLVRRQELRRFRANAEELAALARSEERFTVDIRDQEYWVRAIHGHTGRIVQESAAFEDVTNDPDLPKQLVHGTRSEYVASIVATGIQSGGVSGDRQHVHLVTKPELVNKGFLGNLPGGHGGSSAQRHFCLARRVGLLSGEDHDSCRGAYTPSELAASSQAGSV